MNDVSGPVLVVDDDAGFRAFVTDLLANAGLATVEAASGREAGMLARRERPSTVLLDVKLPDVSGHEVCRELRDSFGETLPILFVSGVKMDELDQAAGLLIGADDYLVKPIEPSELLARVRRVLARAGPSITNSRSLGLAERLTARERQVLALLSDGLSQAEIARELVISRDPCPSGRR